MDVVAIPVLSDNYVFVLRNPADPSRVAIVDPGEAKPVLKWLRQNEAVPEVVLVTHHHTDHVAGLNELAGAFPGLSILGGEGDRGRVAGLTRTLEDGETLSAAGVPGRCLAVPGHTRGHVAYFFPDGVEAGDLFSGDTVFGCTIGNLFEGTPSQMLASLRKIRGLPAGTRLWTAHEYTLAYAREAARFDPGNARLAERVRRLEADPERPSVPLLLDEEIAVNPFFRWDDPKLRLKLGTPDDETTFARLCEIA